ncbi:MAG: IS1595 family transposase [Candidatus Kerfeldbacteria bacterium]
MPQQACPFCMYTRSWKIRRDKRKCKKCRREYSQNRYPVPGIRSTEKEWKQCIHIFLRERTLLRIVDETTIGYNRVQRMVHHIRMCMEGDVPKSFIGPVEMDETYIGGQRKNKRLHIKKIKAKRGHGTDKLPITGVFDRKTGQVYVEVMQKKLSMRCIIDILHKRVVLGSTVYTDAFKIYRMLPKHGYKHQYVDHLQGEYVRNGIHTNNIEGFWGILKRKLSCIGGMRRDRLHWFVAEIAWKYNHRNTPLKEQEEELFKLVIKQ